MSNEITTVEGKSLVEKFSGRFGVEPNKMLATLKATAFRQSGQNEVSNEQMAALLIVSEQYRLNPFTKEVFAFPDKGGIVPVVSVDGWTRIINEHPMMDGVEFSEGPANKDGLPEWIEAVIYRKDRAHPTKVKEFMTECKRGTQPWSTHPRRMLRHKTLIQAARVAFGFAGIYDEDEAQRIIEANTPAKPPATEFTVQKKPEKPEVVEVVEVTTVEAAPAADEPPPPPPEQSAAEGVALGKRKYLLSKAASAGINMADLLAKHGCQVDPETLDGLTEPQFMVLKGVLAQA